MAYLGIDTATRRGSVGLLAGRGPAQEALAEGGRHARDLLTVIAAFLERSELARTDLRGIVVTVGPGSFTGVRVGMATAKGIGLALDIPVVGISTLEALAHAIRASADGQGISLLCPAIEAGRGEVYAALFELRRSGVERRTPDRAWKPAELTPTLPAGAVLTGDGAPALTAVPAEPHRVIETPFLGAALAGRGAEIIPAGGTYQAGGLGPNYVRPSDVEASRRRS